MYGAKYLFKQTAGDTLTISAFPYGHAALVKERRPALLPSIPRRSFTKLPSKTRLVVMHQSDSAQPFIDSINMNYCDSFEIVAQYALISDTDTENAHTPPDFLNLQDIIDFSRQNNVDAIVLSTPDITVQRINEIVSILAILPIKIFMYMDNQLTIPPKFTRNKYQGLSLIPICDAPLTKKDYLLKRSLDWTVLILAAPVLIPLMIVLSSLIVLDSRGPVFFRQKRYGLNNELIAITKFRTLHHSQTDADADKLVAANDTRVTRAGRLLRKTGLDELPQIFEVMKGTMSIVGPRPHATLAKAGGRLYQDVTPTYYFRHRMKPGITGWAQINGYRGETKTFDDINKRVEHDLVYIRNWSIWLDIMIIVKTFATLCKLNEAH